MKATGLAAVFALAIGGWMAVSLAAVQGSPQPRTPNVEPQNLAARIPDPGSPIPGPGPRLS